MTCQELKDKLKEMYDNPDYEKGVSFHLFGIAYAEHIRNCKDSSAKIAEHATGLASFGTEINKGIKLSKFVKIKPGVKL